MPVTDSGVFDAEHPPSRDLVADCVHCGFCLPACPTYLLWQKEADSPRGRIHLMRLGLEGAAELSDGFVRHIDTCLGCMACVTACPSGVQYEKLIEATRQQVERRAPRSLGDRLFRRLIFSLFPYPGRLRLAALGLWAYQRSGLQRLARASGLLARLPARLRAMEGVAPAISLRAAWGATPASRPATGASRKRVGLLLGCVQRVFFSGVNDATARTLAAEGCDVVVPSGQGCCGALMLHAGLERDAAAKARKLIDAFEGADVDTIAINAAGCGSTLKEYGTCCATIPHMPSGRRRSPPSAGTSPRYWPTWSAGAAPPHPAARRLPRRLPPAARAGRHGSAATGAGRHSRARSGRNRRGGVCCGSAGIYNLVEPDAARELGERKARNVEATGADAVASANPGCLLQMRSSLADAGAQRPMYHLVELVDASIRGTSPARPR